MAIFLSTSGIWFWTPQHKNILTAFFENSSREPSENIQLLKSQTFLDWLHPKSRMTITNDLKMDDEINLATFCSKSFVILWPRPHTPDIDILIRVICIMMNKLHGLFACLVDLARDHLIRQKAFWQFNLAWCVRRRVTQTLTKE